MTGTDENPLREHVRERYAAAAGAVTARSAACCDDGPATASGSGGACCGGDEASPEVTIGEGFGAELYDSDDQSALPTDAVAASLGCGNPTAVAELREGETVLDLGSGGGIDVLLSARRVGPTGKAYGVDMTGEMLSLAQANAEEAGATNVEFLEGSIESVPLAAGTVDVLISNCVINLSTDKPAVFAEAYRLLRPGGRVGVSDVVAEDRLTPAQREQRGPYVGCIAGALSISEYRQGLASAGLTDAEIEPTHEVADGMHSAIIRATKPAASGSAASDIAEPGCCGAPGEHDTATRGRETP